MLEFAKRVFNQVQSMNDIAKKVIRYGFRVFVICILVSLVMLVINKHFWGNVYTVTNNSIDLFKASFSILAITIIGGLIMDYVSKNG